ncbi:MFS transporter [Longispora fulva]|uniref:MFS family permease n=1 Tax=Longispora fulva TaxID=619741 RepID=A0A8J7KNM3_9ACTN|nr:MFS transporter [Longispora fulva]MBG6141754.1 MFS family permease [Longispora fulva]GIG59090.1 MFS transporter [Longispora fulva]
MRDIPRLVWVLAGGRFVNAIGSFVSIYLFLYLTGPRHLTLGHAAAVSAALGVGVLAGNFTGGGFGDRFGHRRTLVVTSAVVGVGMIAVPWLPSAVLAAHMALVGYAGATLGVSQGALVALAVPEGDRRRSVAVTRAAFNAGCVLGPPLGAVLAAYSYTWMFVIDGVVTLLVRAVTTRLLPREDPVARSAGGSGRRAQGPTGRGGPRASLWRSLRADRRLLTFLPAIVVVDLVYRQLYSTLPVHLRDTGHPVGLYAALIAIGSGLILVCEIPVTLALRRLPSLGIVGAGYLLVGAGFGLFGVSSAAWVVIGGMVVLTAGEILYKTTANAHVVDAAAPELVGRYQGLYVGLATSGTLLSAPLGAAVYARAPGALWGLCAALAAGAAALAWWSGRPPTRGEPRDPVPAATGVASG